MLNGGENLLNLECVVEVGAKAFALMQGFEKLTKGGDEGVFVPDDVAGLPETVVVDEQVAEAL